jgi:hypothetical protein
MVDVFFDAFLPMNGKDAMQEVYSSRRRMPWQYGFSGLVIALFGWFGLPSQACAVESPRLCFACRADNDLYQALSAGKNAYPRFASAAEAVQKAPRGTGVLLLADGYPAQTTPLAAAVFEAAAAKKLRLYVEYPGFLPGMEITPLRKTKLERVVAASKAFGPDLKQWQILAIHDCHFVEVSAPRPLLVVAKVAGFDTAVYGLKDTKEWPILFEHPRGDILVGTTKLSQFITARYAPKPAIQAVWKYVLKWLAPQDTPPTPEWPPTVRPAYSRDEKLPPDAARQAILRGIDWHTKAGMLLSKKGRNFYDRMHTFGKADPNTPWDALPPEDFGAGDGQYGVLEGVSSRIRCDGKQPDRWWLRTDCNGETSLAFALRWKLDDDPRSKQVAENLLDWVYRTSGLFQTDPAKPNYGLLFWAPDDRQALYHDNDARVILGCLGTSAILGSERWNEALVKNILANYRTTGYLGFRGFRLENPQLLQRGWQHYWRSNTVRFCGNYEAWIWAAYLWLYDKTHDQPLLERTRHAIGMMMEAYPERWQWTNTLQLERGRMLLPLAWLIRVDDRPEHRAWLKRIANDMERCQDSCGAIREELGPPGHGRHLPPPSNAAYGKDEAPIIQQNGDPVADLLYTCNFAALGLHEAYAATGDEQYRRMADKLAEFFVRVQVRSTVHSELDGGWFRAFDYRFWDYFGSNADRGWGAWCIEVGWCQAWIPTFLTLRELNLNLWDLSRNSKAGKQYEKIRREMLGNEPIIPIPGK